MHGTEFSTRALLLRSVPFGEADAIATYFTESHGKLSCLLRSVRRSRKRMPLALEAFHTLSLSVRPKSGEVWLLQSAEAATVRLGLSQTLARSEAAGRYLRWLRALVAAREAEPRLFAAAETVLDTLAVSDDPERPLVAAGTALLRHAGYELSLQHCVRCRRPRPADRSAMLAPVLGGVICRACGGAPLTLSAAALDLVAGELSSASELQDHDVLQARQALDLALAAHADLDEG